MYGCSAICPPTVNAKSVLSIVARLCSKGTAEQFLSSDDLTNAMTAHADVVRLASRLRPYASRRAAPARGQRI